MRRIAIFQCDLKVGGIQRALVNILNQIDYSLCEVDVYLFDDKCFFDLPQHENLNFIYLKPYPFLNRIVYFDILRRSMPVRAGDKSYDIAIDFNSYRNECAIGALGVSASQRIMWIHNDVEIKGKNEIKYKILWHFFKKKFNYFDEFAAVSPGIIDGFRRMTGIYDKKITSIPNHVDTGEIFVKVKEESEKAGFKTDPLKYNFCTMGRICHQKGFDILMGYIAQLKEIRTDFHLYLLGDGPDRDKLTKQIENLKIDKFVTLLGNKPNPFPYLQEMDGFVLTSRYEGQGLVIWEAKALGLEIFITRNLEKYNPGIAGREDLLSSLAGARRKEKIPDDLSEYNAEIKSNLHELFRLDA